MFTTALEVVAVRKGEWALAHHLTWSDTDGKMELSITVPTRFITDFASVPSFMKPLLSDPGESERPFVLHDWLYCSNKRGSMSRGDADALLRKAMIADGHGKLKALTYYLGVRIGGWRYWQRKAQDGLTTEDFIS